MSRTVLKNLGVGCFVACAILLCVAWDRYRDNADRVEAANKMIQGPMGSIMEQMKSNPVGGVMAQALDNARMEPVTPESTKYALVLAAFAAAGGVVCMVKSANAAGEHPSQQVTSPNP